MSDGDWDADEYDAPSTVAPTVHKSLYADEDAEDDVKVCEGSHCAVASMHHADLVVCL